MPDDPLTQKAGYAASENADGYARGAADARLFAHNLARYRSGRRDADDTYRNTSSGFCFYAYADLQLVVLP